MRKLFDSVWGDRMYHWLRGAQTEDPTGNNVAQVEVQKSLGHSHVLAPEFRSPEGSWAVAHKLLHKAAMRLRMEHFYTGSLSVTIRYQLTREQAEARAGHSKVKRHTSGIKNSGWGMEARFRDCQDTLTLLEILRSLWAQRPQGAESQKPFFVGITLRDLIPESEYQAELFADPSNRADLSATMDKLNLKYGHTTLHFAGMLPARESAPTRIAFTQIPVQYGVDYM
jgi:DNA polymerase-4